jgi:hypothetical protein
MSTADAATDAPAPPKFIQPHFDRIPPELKAMKNWLLWAAVWNGTKWTKRPIQISGYGASTNKFAPRRLFIKWFGLGAPGVRPAQNIEKGCFVPLERR